MLRLLSLPRRMRQNHGRSPILVLVHTHRQLILRRTTTTRRDLPALPPNRLRDLRRLLSRQRANTGRNNRTQHRLIQVQRQPTHLPYRAHMTKWMTAAALTLALALGGCSSSDVEDATNEARDRATDALPDVDWSKFDGSVQKRIDKLADKTNCRGLQDEFDAADANGHADLMDYIDAQLENAGCYN